jgi:precorrin-2 dehydrogenase/sirohydrochlorin ferrochelatase
MIEADDVSYYPLMADLTGKSCVIIGGGQVAERKAESLIDAGARVILVSPVCSPQIERWIQSGTVLVLRDYYRGGMQEIRDALLVFAATDSRAVNEAVCQEAKALGKLVSVADHTMGSSFIVPAVVRRGKLVIAISTGGASPAVAKKIRRELEQAFGQEYEVYLELLQELRLLIQSIVGDTVLRQAIFKSMLSWDLLAWIRSGRMDAAARQELIAHIQSDPSTAGMDLVGSWIQSTYINGI